MVQSTNLSREKSGNTLSFAFCFSFIYFYFWVKQETQL